MMHRALSVPANVDLRPLVTLLNARALSHHITEESGVLVVWARSEAEAQLIQACFDAWQQGRLEVPVNSQAQTQLLPVKGLLQQLSNAVWTAPLTVLLIAACLLVALVSDMGSDPMTVRGLFFPELHRPDVSLTDPLTLLQLFTPALLHFGAVHLVFNMLWLWYFGRMMEPGMTFLQYLVLMLWLALAANLAQYGRAGSISFGGMSGVVYGQIGFIWLWQTLVPQTRLRLPTAMIMVFLVALVLMEVLASAFIATAAHAGGLFAGMLAGLLMGLWNRARSSRV